MNSTGNMALRAVRATAIAALLITACVPVSWDNSRPDTPTLRAPFAFYAFMEGPVGILCHDADGDELSYQITVVDEQTHQSALFEWSQYFASDVEVTFLFAPQKEGVFTIWVQVRDTMNATSDTGSLRLQVSKPAAGTWYSGLSSTQADLYAVTFSDPVTAWAAGNGTILKTVNGVFWNASPAPSALLRGIDFASASRGWAVGMGGTILATTDGGSNWVPQTSGTTKNLLAVQFIDETTGWTCGENVMLGTTDGGLNWVPIIVPPAVWRDLDFVSASNGWIVGDNGSPTHTANGGTNWTPQQDDPVRRLMAIDMVDAQVGWVVGTNRTLLYTANGGATWIDRNPGITAYGILDVFFIDRFKGWVMTESDLYYTPDEGGIWFEAVVPPVMQRAIVFSGPSRGCVVGLFGRISYTADGGIDLASAEPVSTRPPGGSPPRLRDPSGSDLKIIREGVAP